MASLLAISDLHVRYSENRRFLDEIRPDSDGDWLIVAGDVGDRFDEIVDTMALLGERFAEVLWVPGNHELWTRSDDAGNGRGLRRYLGLVDALQRIGIRTPEDPYLTWNGPAGPVVIAPLFVLYDYSFRPPGVHSKAEAIALAEAAGVLCTDEALLHPDPYDNIEDWCDARLRYTEARLALVPPDTRTVLINHWPLVREPTEPLWHPEFAIWCGTERTADWPTRYRADAVVYGHLHIPRLIEVDGVLHYEVSLGYPREWQRPGSLPRRVVRILGDPPVAA